MKNQDTSQQQLKLAHRRLERNNRTLFGQMFDVDPEARQLVLLDRALNGIRAQQLSVESRRGS